MTVRSWFLILALTVLGACSADDSNNQPPVVALNVGASVNIEVGETLSIEVSANDPEGGSLQFDYQAKPDGNWSLSSAQFFKSATGARLDWAPIASDVTTTEPLRLIFIVKDDAGKTTEKTVNVTITPGNGTPRFTSSASELYDPRVGKPMKFEVTVRDDDSNEVTMTMVEAGAPIGSSFTQTDAFAGVFEWLPTVEQAKRRVHSVTFVADDGVNDPVEMTVTIVIRSNSGTVIKPGQTDLACPGEAVIGHDPLAAQTTLGDYVIEASLIGSNATRYDEMVIYWTIGNPYGEGSDDPKDAFEGITMESENGTDFVGAIGNQASIIQPGVPLVVSYTICAIDKDSSDATSVVCVPSTGEFNLYHSFAAYLPDDAAECIDDGVDAFVGSGNDDFDSASLISDSSFSFFRTCKNNVDYHALQVRAGEAYVLAVVYGKDLAPTVTGYDDARQPLNMKTSSCTGLSTLEVTNTTNSTQTYYVKVEGQNNIEYQVRAVKTQGGSGGCSDEALEPNENAIDASPVSAGDTVSAEICDEGDIDVYAIDLNAGDEVRVIHAFSNAAGNLDMTLFPPSQADEISPSGSGVAFTFGLVDEEVLTHTATETGTYYLLVFNNNPSSVPYTLDFRVTAAPPCPDNDTYSGGGGNHTQATAALIPTTDEVTLSSLTICPGKPDWYQRTEFTGASVLGELTVNAGEGTIDDISLEAYNLQGTKIADGAKLGNTLSFDYTPASNGQVFIKVSATAKTNYELYILR
ncbi:MAG: hypothetical protein R3E66_17330 [bacterium]